MRKILLTLLTTLLCSVTAWGALASIPSGTLDCSTFKDIATIGGNTSNTGCSTGFFLLKANSADADTLICSGAYLSYNTANINWTTADKNSASSADWSSKYHFKGRTSYNSGGNAKNVNIQNTSQTVAYRVKNCQEVAILGYGNSSSRYIYVKATELDEDGAATATVIQGRNVKNSADSSKVTLDPTKEYYILVQATSDNNAKLYEVAFISKTPSASCSTPAAPTAVTASSTTSSGTTLTITDAANAASYDIYYSTSSTAPEAGTSATATSTSKTKALTGLSASTTYYVWVRSVCDATHKSDWVALTGSTFTTLCTSHTVNAATNNASYGTATAASTTVCEGSTTTVTATPKSGYSFVSWAVSGTGSNLSSTSTNPTTLTMGTANATVTATFGCATPSAPSAMAASSTTSSGTTLTITDAANTNNYEIYYSTSSTAPEAGTSATATSTSKTKALTGLSASTTYYVWVRSVCDSTHKSSWTALTGSSFTTDAACTDPGLTITLN